MFSRTVRLATGVAVALSLVTSAIAQQPQQPAATPAPTPVISRGPDYVDFTGFKGKVFDVKNRDPRSLLEALRPLGSGFKGSTIAYSDEFKTLTVRDFPENIAAIEEALKRLDTPPAARSDVEIRMNILIATSVAGVVNEFPNDLADVVKQMQATLNYKSYTNVATVVQRVKMGARNISLNGSAEIPAIILGMDRGPQSASYRYGVRELSLTADPSGGFTAQLIDTRFEMTGSAGPAFGQATIATDISLRIGDKVVVGTATLGNKGVILVLSARVVK
jgi:Bacterial type II/III secretion system short domain